MCNLLAVTRGVIVLFTVAIKFVLAFTFHDQASNNLLFVFCLPPNLGYACWQNLGVRLPWFIMLSFIYVVGARIET